MADVFFAANDNPNTIDAARYFCISGELTLGITNELFVQVQFIKDGGTFYNGKIYISANATTAGSTCVLRKNATGTTLSISIGSGLTGLFEDNSNQPTIAANDLVDWLVTPGSANNLSIETISVSFTPTSYYYQQIATGALSSSATVSRFGSIGDRLGVSNETEANAQLKFKSSATLENLYVYVSVNASALGVTLRTRVNGANGNLNVSITTLTTGVFTDTSNSDSISSGDLVCYELTSHTTGAVTIRTIACSNTNSSNNSEIMAANPPGSAVSSTTTRYVPCGGSIINFTATEANAQVEISASYTVSNLRCYVTANTATDSATVDFREGAASPGPTISIAGGATGYFEDTSNTASVVADDLINLRVVAASDGDITMASIAALFTAPVISLDSIQQLTLLGVG